MVMKNFGDSIIYSYGGDVNDNGWPMVIHIDYGRIENAVYYHSDRLSEILRASSANVELRRAADKKIKKLTEEIVSLKGGQEG